MKRALVLVASMVAGSCAPAPAASPQASRPEFKDEPQPRHALQTDVAFHGAADDAPEPSASASDVPPASDAPPASSAPTPASADASSRPDDGASAPEQVSARKLLTTAGAGFFIDYDASAPKKAAEAKCDQEHPGDDPARDACMTKARSAFQADMLAFPKDVRAFQDPNAGFSMITYKQTNSALAEVHTARITFGDETGSSVTVKFTGREQGARAICKHAQQFVVTAPNGYTIVIDDPDLGELRYQAKVGLLGALNGN